MRLLICLFLALTSTTILASNYECITGVREIYRGNMEKPVASQNFSICEKLIKSHHKKKA